MNKKFRRSGICFDYPQDWQLNLDESADGWTVVVQSPITAFCLVCLNTDSSSASQVADETLFALNSEYANLEAEPASECIAGLPAIGHDIDFLAVDTTVSCWTRCIDTPNGALLLLCQTSELDRIQHEPSLRMICDTLMIFDE